MMIKKILNLFRRADEIEDRQAHAPQDLSYSEFLGQNEDIIKCYKFSATLSPETPLNILKRHGETKTKVDKAELSEISRFYIWTAELDNKYAFLSEGHSMSSAVGSLPPDGGDFLDYIINFREIVERPIQKDQTELDDIIAKCTEIKKIKSGYGYEQDQKCRIKKREVMNPQGDYLSLMTGGDTDWLLKFLIRENSEYSTKGLTADHVTELRKQGFSSIQEILNAPDVILLNLKGIGPKRLEIIRQNLIKPNRVKGSV